MHNQLCPDDMLPNAGLCSQSAAQNWLLVTHAILEPLLWPSLPRQFAEDKIDNAVGIGHDTHLPLGMTVTSKQAVQCKHDAGHMPSLWAAGGPAVYVANCRPMLQLLQDWALVGAGSSMPGAATLKL